jgi:hypothetical protein
MRNETRYGSGSVEGPTPAARELFLLAAAKHGLGARDLPPCCSFFQGVRVDPDSGSLEWTGSCGGPSTVELRAELPLVVLIVNTAHPLDGRPDWSCGSLEVLAWPGPPTAPADSLANRSPEAQRAFRNNESDLASRAGVPA